jgi:hypothetical protein
MGQVSKIDFEKYAKKEEENPQVVDKKEGDAEV